MDRNYWTAIILSMIILLAYPFFMRWVMPNKAANVETVSEEEITEGQSPSQASAPPIAPADGPFIEKQTAPTLSQYSSSTLDATFSTLGGTLTQLNYAGESADDDHLKTPFFEGEVDKPGILGLRILHEPVDLQYSIFKLTRLGANGEAHEFAYEKPGEYKISKKFTFDENKPVIYLDLEIENLGEQEKHFPLEFVYGLNYHVHDRVIAHTFQAVAKTQQMNRADLPKIQKKGFTVSADVEWSGLLKKYYAFLVKPDWKAIDFQVKADDKIMWGELKLEPLTVPAKGKVGKRFLVVVGPQRYELLKSFDYGFDELLFSGFFGIFKVWLLQALKFFNQFTHNYGWDIILLTLLLKLAFTPLTHISYESMKKMQALQPKIKSIQERFKNDPTKMNHEMMQLWKRNKVNPMGGCLPMVAQIPIFIAFYQVLNDAVELRGAPFMGWIKDLSEPDRLFAFGFSVPFIGDAFNFLPLLMLGSMVWQQKLTPQAGGTPEQTKVMAFMPIIFGVMFYQMPSGLVLYWFVNNLLTIIHQIFVKRIAVVLHHEDRD